MTLPRLGDLQPILNTRFTRASDNRYIMAQFYPPRQTATGGVEDPFRIVRAGARSPLKAGDVLLGDKCRKYLVLRSGTEERDGSDCKVFKAIELDRSGTVRRVEKVLDPVTKRTNDTLVDVAPISYMQIPLRPREDGMRIQYDQYEILTDFALRLGDHIDEKVVDQVEVRLDSIWARVRDA